MRERPPDNASAPESARKFRRWIRIGVTPCLVERVSAKFRILPAIFFAGDLEDRSFRERLGLLCRRDCLVEIAGGGRLLGRLQRGFSGRPLVTQGASLLLRRDCCRKS